MVRKGRRCVHTNLLKSCCYPFCRSAAKEMTWTSSSATATPLSLLSPRVHSRSSFLRHLRTAQRSLDSKYRNTLSPTALTLSLSAAATPRHPSLPLRPATLPSSPSAPQAARTKSPPSSKRHTVTTRKSSRRLRRSMPSTGASAAWPFSSSRRQRWRGEGCATEEGRGRRGA